MTLNTICRAAATSRRYHLQGVDGDAEVAALRRERDELQGLLDKFERHMSEVTAAVTCLQTKPLQAFV